MKVVFTALASAIFGSAISLTIVSHAQTAKTPSAVAYVAASRILAESTHGRTEAGRIQALQQQRATDLRTKQQALESTRQQLATTGDGAARVTLQQKELQQRTELERSTAQAQLDLQTLQREVNAEMQRRVRLILDDLLKTQGYSLVLNADTSLMWAAPDVDLTAAVVGRMNAAQ